MNLDLTSSNQETTGNHLGISFGAPKTSIANGSVPAQNHGVGGLKGKALAPVEGGLVCVSPSRLAVTNDCTKFRDVRLFLGIPPCDDLDVMNSGQPGSLEPIEAKLFSGHAILCRAKSGQLTPSKMREDPFWDLRVRGFLEGQTVKFPKAP